MFITDLCLKEIGEMSGRSVYSLLLPLKYKDHTVPEGFQTDLGSVPRVPLIYGIWGDRAHREAVLHDYLYRYRPGFPMTRKEADQIFLEAMKSRGVKFEIYYPMYMGVRLGGGSSFHKYFVGHKFFSDVEEVL
jgi:hypothetical protein